MLGSMFQGFLQIVLRVWTLGVFYFLNNRLFSWLKESRIPMVLYQKVYQTKEEGSYNKEGSLELSIFKSNNFSRKNSIFMNLLNSKNSGKRYRNMSTIPTLFQAYKRQGKHCIKDNSCDSSLVISFDFCCDLSCRDTTKTIVNDHCTALVPQHCYSRNFDLTKASIYRQYIDNIMQEERAKQVAMEYLKKDGCMLPQEMHCRLLQNDIYKEKYCIGKEEELTHMKEHLFPKDMFCSLKESIYEDCSEAQQDKMADMGKTEYMFTKEPHCSSAASIDSGFQSCINTTYTCLDIDGVMLYISDIHHNKKGKVTAMTIGFSIVEDSSEESLFSDEEDEDEDLCDDDDVICFDNDEDFIVFDTGECPVTDQLKFAVNLSAPAFEVQFSQTLSPKSNYFCLGKLDKYEQKVISQIDSKTECGTPALVANSEEENINDKQKSCSAGTVRTRKVQFDNKVEIHPIVMWDYAYRKARLGPWKDLATDRLHFQRRIQELNSVIEPVLLKKITEMNSRC